MKVKCSRFITDWVSPNRTLRKLLAATHNRSKQAWAECFNLANLLLFFPSLQNKPCQCFALISAAQCATPGAMLEPRWVDTKVCPCWGQSNLHDFTGLEPRWKLIPVRNREGCKWDQVKARCLRHRWDLINPLALNMWSKALWASDSVLCRHGQLAERQVSRCGDDGDLITFDGTKMFGGFFFSWAERFTKLSLEQLSVPRVTGRANRLNEIRTEIIAIMKRHFFVASALNCLEPWSRERQFQGSQKDRD